MFFVGRALASRYSLRDDGGPALSLSSRAGRFPNQTPEGFGLDPEPPRDLCHVLFDAPLVQGSPKPAAEAQAVSTPGGAAQQLRQTCVTEAVLLLVGGQH